MKNSGILHRIMALALLFVCFPLYLSAQDDETDEDEDYIYTPDTVFLHDTTYIFISDLNDITEKLGISYDRYVRRFLLYLNLMDSTRRYSPEEVYLNYFMPMLQTATGFSDKRWIRGVFSLYASPDTAFMSYNPAPVPDTLARINRNADIMFECRGEMNTDFFLKSPGLINTYLIQLFRYIHQTNSAEQGKIRGVNFYFPDFSFREKRAMAQFAKSVALVTDFISLKTINSLKVYFSFGERGASEREYLSCIASMTDSIFILDGSDPDRLFAGTTVITKKDADDYFLLTKVTDQFYLAGFCYPNELPYTSPYEFRDSDIVDLINSDYPENNWEIYAAILLVIVILIVLFFTLYWTIPAFPCYLNKNRDYMITLFIVLSFEVFLLLFSMVEAMSRDSVFDFSSKNKSIVFLMPVLLVFILPLLKMVRNRKDIP